MDRDKQKWEDLSGEFNAPILQGDGTGSELLKSEGARETDTLIPPTNSDTLNVVISTLGTQL
ncbi:MAG: NAD-binding protein [Candidatus Acetothermia bacterium]